MCGKPIITRSDFGSAHPDCRTPWSYAHLQAAIGTTSLRWTRRNCGARPLKDRSVVWRKCTSITGVGSKTPAQVPSLFIVCPHAYHFDDVAFFKDLIDQAMLNIDATRVSPCQVADEFLEPWWSLERIYFKYLKNLFRFGFEASCFELLGVSISLLRIDKRLFHQVSSVEHFSTGVFNPRTIFSRILGTESRYNVSWMASQSSMETRTPAFFFPTIWIGSCDFSDSVSSVDILAFLASTVFIMLTFNLTGYNIINSRQRFNGASPPMAMKAHLQHWRTATDA